MGQVNIRVPDEKVDQVRARLKSAAESLGISQGDVLERCLESLANGAGPVDDLAQKTYERAGRIETMVEELLELGAPVSNPSLPTETVPASEFRTPESIPGVQRGMPPRRISYAEQRKIDTEKHLGEVAGKDKLAVATGRDDIEYDPQA